MLAASQIDLSAQKKKDKDNTSTDEKKEEKSILEKTFFPGLKFRNIGPAITSGRISDFAMHPDNPKIYYVATAAGGVWQDQQCRNYESKYSTSKPTKTHQDLYVRAKKEFHLILGELEDLIKNKLEPLRLDSKKLEHLILPNALPEMIQISSFWPPF